MASNREREEPPSKKRVASRQISKDDDPEAEEDDGTEGGGTFPRASNEVLAERRIVKVRRTPVASSAPNPFADIRLIPPTVPTSQETTIPSLLTVGWNSNLIQKSAVAGVLDGGDSKQSAVDVGEKVVVEEAVLEVAISPESGKEPVTSEVKDLDTDPSDRNVVGGVGIVGENAGLPTQVVVVDPVTSVDKDVTNNPNTEEQEKARETESVGPSGTSSETFQQLSSAKNAFAGSFGTGFSSTPFIFSSSSSASSQSSGFAFGQAFPPSSQPFGSSLSFGAGTSPFGSQRSSAGAFPSLLSVFGKSNGSGSTQVFGSLAPPPAAAPTSGQPSPAVVSLQEVHVETGEEKEKAVFTADASLFEFSDGGWKERGKGELRVNVSEEKDKRPRLVMRSKGNYRLLLNASLFPDMKLSKMDNRGISFVCANSAAEGKTGLTTYAVKVKDGSVASEFSATVQAHKGNANTEPRTPESSPKATERPSKAVETSEIDV